VITEETRHSERTEDEESLIRRSQANPEAFKPLYEKYFRKIFLFILHRVGDKSLAADITSQAFLKALLNLNKFQFRGLPFSAWLFRIALNECNDFFRKKKRYRIVTIENAAIEELHEELTADTGLQELWKKLPHILEQLNTGELQLIELRYFEQRPFKEVADILAISETYAKVRTYRILEKMKRLFLEQQ
jgi:RNA polymerase sigma-70 factor, ECF subfamily